MRDPIKLIGDPEIDYHRNGVSGEGFHIIKFRALVDGEERNMLATVFSPDEVYEDGPSEGEPRWIGGEFHNPRVAVLDADLLAEGDIGFGRNSWRGDSFAPVLYKAIAEKNLASYNETLRSLGKPQLQMTPEGVVREVVPA